MLLWFRKPPALQKEQAEKLYAAIVAQARQPLFYRDLAVPDTIDGRFDMILMHSFIVMLRLREDTTGSMQALSQTLYDIMFVDMDRAIREMGIGDLSVGKHIRRMMKAFNGRMSAYENGLNDSVEMKDAIRRNVYGTVTDIDPAVVDAMAKYLQDTLNAVRAMPLEMLIVGGQMPWAGQQRQAA